MEEFMANFHFLRPWWLLLLFLPLIGFARSLKGQGLQSSWQKIVDARLLDFLLVRGSSTQRRLLSWVAFLGFATAIVAAAGPSWQKVELPALESKNPAMILLNLSSDMKAADLTPSRLERAKYKIKDLLGTLGGVQAGLEVYSGEPFVISPLTDDTKVLANLLPAIDYNIMPLNGDRLDRAIELAVERFRGAQYQQGEIIVFAPDVGQKFEAALDAAKKAKALGYTVNIIGTAADASEKLAMVAQAGGGTYAVLQHSDADILPLAQKIVSKQTDVAEGRNWQSVWLDYGWYLLAVPLLCCLYFFRRGILVIAFACLLDNPAYAGFFLNANQEGFKAFTNQDYGAAAQSFDAPEWKGASYYRMGEYDKAYAEYARGSGETALYNQGNALAKGGKIKEAIAKYEEVLKLNPRHDDAKFNLEYLKKQQEQQQNQQQQQQNQPQPQNQGQEDQQNQDQQSQSPSEQQSDEQQQQKNDDNRQSGKSDSQNAEQQEQDNQDEQTTEANEQSPQELDASSEQEQAEQQGGAVQQQGQEDDEEYDEKIQARAQQLREIPEDPGGLLRAFIAQEYRRNRYNQNQEMR